MSEEAIVEESSFDMDGAVESLGNDLFGTEPEEVIEDDFDEEPEEAIAEEEPEEVEKEVVSKKTAPQSWKKEMHSFYEGLDPVVQDYIIQREEQMREGLEKDRGDANLGKVMRDITAPYDNMFKDRGIEAPQAVQYLLQAHYSLTNGTPAQKIQLLNQLAQSYGVGQQQQSENPEINGLTQRLAEIEQNLKASQQRVLQAEQTRIESEVSSFADDHPLFDDLTEDIAKLIQVGYGLEEAYDKAVWSNPVTRQKELDRINGEKAKEVQKQVKKETETAKNAKSVNVKSRNTKKAPTAPAGTMEDTMREVMREINSRN